MKEITAQTSALVYIEWEDSSLEPAGWKHLEDIGDYDHAGHHCFSVGWEIRSTKLYVTIAGNHGNEQVSSLTNIPRRAIVHRIVLKAKQR